MNVLGDAGGRKYNRRPYEDVSLFEPTNSPYKIKDKSKWQPLIKTNDYGIFTIQTFVTPQWGRTRPYTHDNGNAFRVPPPRDSDYDDNRPGYVAQVKLGDWEQSIRLGVGWMPCFKLVKQCSFFGVEEVLRGLSGTAPRCFDQGSELADVVKGDRAKGDRVRADREHPLL